MRSPIPIWRRFDSQVRAWAARRQREKVGKRIPARIATTAVTTSSSIRVKPLRLIVDPLIHVELEQREWRNAATDSADRTGYLSLSRQIALRSNGARGIDPVVDRGTHRRRLRG